MKSRLKSIMLIIIAALIAAGLYYYIVLPPVNIHAPGFWGFVIFILVVVTIGIALASVKKLKKKYKSDKRGNTVQDYEFVYKSKGHKVAFYISLIATIAVVVIFIVGSVLSSEMINASKYQKLMSVETRVFEDDIHEVSYDKIPILDKDSAANVGNRVMGSMVDMVSQFEVTDLYSQINYKDRPVRVTPLTYGGTIKWFTNMSDGIPGYIRIDMTTQAAECVRLEEGMKYTAGDHFNRNIYRHLRFNYPTYMFDELSFEIDEEGVPYWICPVKKYNIGLFGGVTIGRVVTCNAITGECVDYAVEDAPTWIDKVYSAEMLINLYDYYGTLKHGYFNSVLSQKDCLMTTEGYNYVALEDDVWVYTGVTSVGQDESNVGFVLMNQRTMKTRYYEVPGAEEYSAMDSAEGKVQHLGYKATFPLVLNVGGEPTYFMALKDSAGLVKSYAMLNIEKYQTVAIGDTVGECERNYLQMLADSGISKEPEKEEKQITGKLERIVPVVVGGNSHYYVMLEGADVIYDISAVDNPKAIMLSVGDEVTLLYTEGAGVYSANLK